ncbi:hypothetical protein GGQ76_001656 [Aureimonas jatrophae]|jgi:hypothetical protein|uniref:Uncharacterized protein n=1 Tax=Aureimonas jatrophae TaxID=1166073 RepID=A0A1H0EQU3_9HYPH|nr:hypothetical protein [Aureimonas jatrophae]SDN84663.1 hypothetical protein SAMN05192530_102171 [Aureimonas jatrophae]
MRIETMVALFVNVTALALLGAVGTVAAAILLP